MKKSVVSDICWVIAAIALSLIMLTTEPSAHKGWILSLAITAGISTLIGLALNRKNERE